MLSSIKDKLLNVTKTVPLFSGNSDKGYVQSKVNLNAGSEILAHFETEWEVLHDTNEHNAKKTEEAAATINTISQRINRDKENLGLMTHILTHSSLKANITSCTKQIEQLYTSFSEVEEGLLQLEDLIDDVELETMKKQHRFHLHQYKLRKEESLKNLEATLKEKHDKTVVEHELRKKKESEERQQVFHEAFKTDLEIFKNCGTIPKLEIAKKQPSALLEEIQVDFDESELNQFFADNPTQ